MPRQVAGRPPAKAGTARTSVLAIKLSTEDRQRIEMRAARAGVGPTTYVREAALKARVTNARPASAPSMAEMAQIAALNDIALAITKAAARLASPGDLNPQVRATFDKVTGLVDVMTGQAELRDRAVAYQQKIAAELAHIGRNLNQITRAVNTMARRRDGDVALPPYTRAVLKDIAALIEKLPPAESEPGDAP